MRDDSWVERVEGRDPRLQRQRQRRATVEQLITAARLEAGLDTNIFRPRRGRRLRHKHPFPLVPRKPAERVYDPGNHKEFHQDVKVEGCTQCYMREYSYFARHPEEKLAHERGALLTNKTLGVRMDGRPRPYQDPGWEKYFQSSANDFNPELPKTLEWNKDYVKRMRELRKKEMR